jgi:hypothetical protein
MAVNNPINLNVFQEALTGYVVTPLNAFGIGGFVFDTEGETTANLTAEITDHFVEDGSTISDHIAIKPKKITLKNYVGELVYRQDDSTDTFVQKVARKLTTVSNYLPEITTMAQQVLDLRRSGNFLESLGNLNVSKTINRVSDFWALSKNLLSGQSKQQQAFMYFKAMYEQKLLLSVQTPFEFMNSMAIESITAIQNDGEKYVSDFTITLKQIRTAKEIYASKGSVKIITDGTVDEITEFMQERAPAQYADVSNQGNIPGLETLRNSPEIEAARAAQSQINVERLYSPAKPLNYNVDSIFDEYQGDTTGFFFDPLAP